MKTAMKEMIQNIIDIESKTYNQEQLYMLTALKVSALILLEKEKQQIIDACNANLKGLLTNGKDYYDLNFNHHIESEPNTYTNFTPHNANAVAEYNEGLKNFTPNK